MQQNYNPNECQAAPVPQPVAQGQAPNNYGTYQQPAPAPAPAPQYYQQPAPAGQPVNNYGYGAAGSPQPVQGQVQETQYTGYGTGGVVASHGTGSVVTGTGSLKGFAAGMNKLATGVALAFGNASGGRVVTPGGVAVAGNVPAGDGVCHFNQCRFFMKTGYCSGGHTLQCQDMNCAFYHHWVDPGHVHQAKPMQEVVVGQPVLAPQPQAGSPQVLQTVPGTTTVPLGSGTQNGHLHGSGTVTLGSYGTGTAVVGAAPINDLAYTMNRAVTGVALAAGPVSGGAVVSPSGAVVQGGDIPCGTGECHYNQCKFFMKSGYCVSGHTVQCRNQACPSFLQYCPPGHVCTQK